MSILISSKWFAGYRNCLVVLHSARIAIIVWCGLLAAHRFFAVLKEDLNFAGTGQAPHNADSENRMIHQ